jgi:ABC-type branched-subunit amino acid transport system substrate-binding protein
MRHWSILTLLILSACTSPPSKKVVDEKIRPSVQTKLDQAREALTKNNPRLALTRLGELADNDLVPTEKAMKYNLKGVVLFTQTEWDKAQANFEVARKYVPEGSVLEAQVWLNTASVHFKQGLFAELKDSLDEINPDVLSDPEVRKYAQLKLAWAVKYQKSYEIVETSAMLLKNAKSLAEVQDSILKERMSLAFSKLSDGEKSKLLDTFGEKNWLPLAYLGQLEAESRYFKGDTAGARDVISWLGSRFGDQPSVKTFIQDFEKRLDSSSRISMEGIGVILPMSGEKGAFGNKALLGIDAAIKGSNLGRSLEIHTQDDADSAAVGAQAVRDLVQRHKVPLIIGGLFPDTARAEYLEAKRWGVLYVALAPVHLPREEKNYLLIEVQGSTQSQVAALVSEEMLKHFGRRIGVIYPEGEAGKAYVDEFWRTTLTRGTSLTGVSSYAKGTLDFRNTVQHFLGLQFPREREEELEIFQSAYALEKNSIRRIQTLPPVLDADWVFVASYPHEALSLVPTFGYYDAPNLPIFGGPSWGSRNLVKEQRNLGRLHFVGEDPADINQEFFRTFQETHGAAPTLIETLGFDAAKIAAQLVRDDSPSQRTAFDENLKSQKSLVGLSAEWKLVDGLWIKDMQPLIIRNGEIKKLFESPLR